MYLSLLPMKWDTMLHFPILDIYRDKHHFCMYAAFCALATTIGTTVTAEQ